MFKQIIIILLWIVMPASLVVLMGFVQKKQQYMPFKSIEINIDYTDGNFFVDQNDIRSIIYCKGDSLIGSHRETINLSNYERLINQHPSVQKAQLYSSVDGKLFINVWQRKPLIRVMNNLSTGYYIDNQGRYMPLSDNYTARVIIANSCCADIIPNDSVVSGFSDGVQSLAHVEPGKSMLADLYILAKYINSDTLWNAMFEQVYINTDNEIELIPKVGNHKIIIGKVEGLEQKFKNLKLFYIKGLNRKGWDNYEVINLKFKNQIVCTKKQI